MSMYISILLYFFILAGSVAVAILPATDNPIVMWLGIVIALFSLLAGLLTTRDIDKLQKKAKNAVYFGEIIGRVPNVDTTALKEQLKKEYPDLNP